MPGAIGYERNQALGFAELFQNHFHQLEVGRFITAAEIVNRARFAFEDRRDHGSAMILNVDPVAHIQPVAVNRQRLLAQRFDDHERDQFLRKLIGAVIVRAAGHDHFLAVGFMMREREKIRADFARGIGRAGIKRRIFFELSGFA